MKCAFATALVKENETGSVPSLRGQVAYGTLTLNVVYKRNADFSIKGKAVAGGPFVFSYLAQTGSILPSSSHSSAETNTIKTDINFRYYLDGIDKDVCGSVDSSTQARYGFTEWLASVMGGMDENAYQYPRGLTARSSTTPSSGWSKPTRRASTSTWSSSPEMSAQQVNAMTFSRSNSRSRGQRLNNPPRIYGVRNTSNDTTNTGKSGQRVRQ